MQPEATFKKRLKDGFAAACGLAPHYWFPLVASMMQKAGVPDLFIADGKIGCWIEAKVNGNGLSPIQVLEQRKMAMAGAIVVVLHCNLDKPEGLRGIDRGVFTKAGDYLYLPDFESWGNTTSPLFWQKIIHG
jgi:hypothetical protein